MIKCGGRLILDQPVSLEEETAKFNAAFNARQERLLQLKHLAYDLGHEQTMMNELKTIYTGAFSEFYPLRKDAALQIIRTYLDTLNFQLRDKWSGESRMPDKFRKTHVYEIFGELPEHLGEKEFSQMTKQLTDLVDSYEHNQKRPRLWFPRESERIQVSVQMLELNAQEALENLGIFGRSLQREFPPDFPGPNYYK